MGDSETDSGGIERGPNVGVPGGSRLIRPEGNMDSPLSPEEKAKFESLLGAEPAQGEKAPPREHPLALVADDDPDARYFEVYALKKFGFSAIEANTGKDALLQVHQQKPDLILLDLKMPDMDGFEVIRGIRSFLKRKKMMIVVMTSSSTVKNEVTALSLGADEVIIKPVNKDKLAAKIDALRRRLEADKE